MNGVHCQISAICDGEHRVRADQRDVDRRSAGRPGWNQWCTVVSDAVEQADVLCVEHAVT